MNYDELYMAAVKESEWLKYYGHKDTRNVELFEDHLFYDRIISIGYTKVVLPLHWRCAMLYVTADKPVLSLDYCDINPTYGPRNHENNTYTALEYMFGRYRELSEAFIQIIKL